MHRWQICPPLLFRGCLKGTRKHTSTLSRIRRLAGHSRRVRVYCGQVCLKLLLRTRAASTAHSHKMKAKQCWFTFEDLPKIMYFALFSLTNTIHCRLLFVCCVACARINCVVRADELRRASNFNDMFRNCAKLVIGRSNSPINYTSKQKSLPTTR